jgi:hypothetical protein
MKVMYHPYPVMLAFSQFFFCSLHCYLAVRVLSADN